MLAKFVHLAFFSSIALAISAAIFLYPLEARIAGGGFSAEAMESAIWFLFFLWIAYLPTFFLFSYVSSISSTFMISVIALVVFIVYPVGRTIITSHEGPESREYRDTVAVWDTVSPTSLPWNFSERMKDNGWMAVDCRTTKMIREEYFGAEGKAESRMVEKCAYSEPLEKIF